MLPPDYRGILSSCMDALSSDALSPRSDAPAPEKDAAVAEVKVALTTIDGCIRAYPWQDWLQLEEQFRSIPNPSASIRRFIRVFVAGAEEQTIDAQGRIRLSADHREYAGISGEVTILGLINRFEIWDPERYRLSTEGQDMTGIAEELAAYGMDFSL
ncbi:MAG: cell division/cell wall cluster transcriptional repressor MraZ [Mailhella sp.]|nr:cell division/cell wall cluster transcriptional repressor MraZ [Mailhella sp.]